MVSKIQRIQLSMMVVFILILAGCVSVGNDSLRKEDSASVKNKIQAGVTTKDQVKNMFGDPMTTTYTDSGMEIWKYEFSKTSADAISYIPVVGLFASSASGTKKELTILFDDQDRVKKFNMASSPIKARTGLFNQ